MTSRNCWRRGKKRRRKRKKRKEAKKRRSDLLVSLHKVFWSYISSNLEAFSSQSYSTIHTIFCLFFTLAIHSIVAAKLLSTTSSSKANIIFSSQRFVFQEYLHRILCC
jgi:hypothetical protein